jgi:hypothetical protein
MSDKVAAGIGHGDVHRLLDLLRLSLGRGNHLLRIVKRKHLSLLRMSE